MSKIHSKFLQVIEKQQDSSISELSNHYSSLQQESIINHKPQKQNIPTQKKQIETKIKKQTTLKVEHQKHQPSTKLKVPFVLSSFMSNKIQNTSDVQFPSLVVPPIIPKDKNSSLLQNPFSLDFQHEQLLSVLKLRNTSLYEISLDSKMDQSQTYSVKHVGVRSTQQIASCKFSNNKFIFTQFDIKIQMKFLNSENGTYSYSLVRIQQPQQISKAKPKADKKMKIIAQFVHRPFVHQNPIHIKKYMSTITTIESVCSWSNSMMKSKTVQYNFSSRTPYLECGIIDLKKTTPSILSTVMQNQQDVQQFVIFQRKEKVYLASRQNQLPGYLMFCFVISKMHHKFMICQKSVKAK